MNCPLIIQLWNLSLLFIILLLLLSNGTLPIYICISEYSNLTRLNRVLMVIDSDSLQKVPDSQIDKSKILKSKSHKVQKSQCTKSQNTQVPMSMSVTVSIPGHQFLAQVSLVLSLSQSWVPLSPLLYLSQKGSHHSKRETSPPDVSGRLTFQIRGSLEDQRYLQGVKTPRKGLMYYMSPFLKWIGINHH